MRKERLHREHDAGSRSPRRTPWTLAVLAALIPAWACVAGDEPRPSDTTSTRDDLRELVSELGIACTRVPGEEQLSATASSPQTEEEEECCYCGDWSCVLWGHCYGVGTIMSVGAGRPILIQCMHSRCPYWQIITY